MKRPRGRKMKPGIHEPVSKRSVHHMGLTGAAESRSWRGRIHDSSGDNQAQIVAFLTSSKRQDSSPPLLGSEFNQTEAREDG